MKTNALKVLEQTSRTFYLPIVRLPARLQEAVVSGYLSMRAIDEIEDHPTLDTKSKTRILKGISLLLQSQTTIENFQHERFDALFDPYRDQLPEVSLRLAEWACYAPNFIAARIWEATAAMADRMGHWAANGFKVVTRADLDRYTYGVAGAVGLLLCDIWAWYEEIQIHRSRGIQFGRGLQSVNIIRNRNEDLERGVDFYPENWTDEDMQAYARTNLEEFDDYLRELPETTFLDFVRIPRALALATLDAIADGREKLTRTEVLKIVSGLKSPT